MTDIINYFCENCNRKSATNIKGHIPVCKKCGKKVMKEMKKC